MSPALPGRDLVLTIDRDIQYAAERVAADVTARFNADGATIVVMEIATGEILGMASAPTFDPNDRRTEEREFWRNRAVTDMFEPGSIQKTFTIAAALESGAISADTTFRVPDRYTVAGKTFSDVSKHGVETWTAADILSRSSNVGAIMIAQQAGVSTLRDHLGLLSYGRPTGLRFPGEVGGLMPAQDQWWATTLPTVAIGYGTATTLLQMASLYAAVANDGVRVEPVLVRGTVGSDGNLEPSSPPLSERLFSSETSSILLEMLGQAVDGEGATGTQAQIPGYRVGGKTGTVIKSNIGTGGYSDRYISSFVGVAPLDDPRLVVAVMVDGPRPIHYGGAVAAPAFAEVMHASLLARRIVPDGAGRSLQELVEVTRTMALEDAAARAAAAELASREPASADPATTAAPDSR
jgi:cell division protein FtsI (penicillin-binding protein 3)